MISVKVKHALKGAHVHLAIYLGPDADHRALAGQLIVRKEEWPEVQFWLQATAQMQRAAIEHLTAVRQRITDFLDVQGGAPIAVEFEELPS